MLIACGDNLAGPAPDAPATDDWLLEQLAPEQGFSVRTPEFAVAAGQEVQDCYFFAVPDLDGGRDLLVDRTRLGLEAGSHHLNLFRVKTIVALDPAAGEPVELGAGLTGTVVRGADSAECWKSANWADWPLVANSQQSTKDGVVDWQLPQGVAARFHPGEMLMLQIHYVNATDQVTPRMARGGANFYRSHDGDTMELGTLFASQKQVRVCRSKPAVSFSARCAFPSGTHTIAAANGHFHSHGQEFRIWTWDGAAPTIAPTSAPFYDNRDWNDPRMDTSLAVDVRGGVMWSCDYQWREPEGGCAALDAADPMHANDCCYTFGPKVESNEHCNMFLYYYPKVDAPIACSSVP